MSVVQIHLEVMALSAGLMGLHRLRYRLGLGPVYLAMGMLLTFVLIGDRLAITMPVFGGQETLYTSVVHLGLALTALVVLYVLDGTAEARRAITALVLGGLLLLVLQSLLAAHLLTGDLALEPHGRSRWNLPDPLRGLVEVTTLLIDGVVIVVVFQAVTNLWRRTPVVLTLPVALLAALATDTLVHSGMSKALELDVFVASMVSKLTTGLALSLPAALYVTYVLRHDPKELREAVLHRNPLQIVSLRRALAATREEVLRSQTEMGQIREAFGHYVAPDVVDDLLQDTEEVQRQGEVREVTVLFSDIMGYTTLTEQLDPQKTLGLLNQYFEAMSAIVQDEGGTVIEFEGDAILASFNAPNDEAEHPQKAVIAALRMLATIDELNERWNADGTSEHWRAVNLASFLVRIGLHTGTVVAGQIGGASHSKYAVIGDAVNTAARVEQLNKRLGTLLLLTDVTAERIGDMDVPLTDMGTHRVRGRKEAVRVFTPTELVGRGPTGEPSAR